MNKNILIKSLIKAIHNKDIFAAKVLVKRIENLGYKLEHYNGKIYVKVMQ